MENPQAANTAGAVVDPLAIPAGDIDTRFPRLTPDRVYRMIIRSPEKKVNEKSVEMVVFKLETTQEAMDTDSNVLHPGFKFTHRLIGVSGERDIEAVKKDTAMILKAVHGAKTTITPRDLWNDPAAVLDGKPVDVKVGIQKEKDGFPESNVVRTWVLPA